MTKAIEAWILRNEINFKDNNEKKHLIDFLSHKFGYKNSINFSYSQCVEKADAWVTELNLKNLSQVDLGKVETVFEEGPYKIVRLLDQTARNYEGAKMSHCVASYTDDKKVYSLRDQADLPHATIHVHNGQIMEISGKGNGAVSPKYVDFLVKFLDKSKIEMDEYSLQSIGYFHNQEILNLLKGICSNLKYKTFNGKEYIYTKNKIKFLKPLVNEPADVIHNLMSYLCYSNQNREDLLNLVKAREDLLIKNNPVLTLLGRCDISLSPIQVALTMKNLELSKYLIQTHIKDYGLLFKKLRCFREVFASEDEEFIRYLLNKGLRIDEDFDLSQTVKYNFHRLAIYIIKRTKDLSIVELLEKAGLDCTKVQREVLWVFLKEILTQNDLVKLAYFSKMRIPLDDHTVALILTLDKDHPAFNLFLKVFDTTLEEITARINPEVEKHLEFNRLFKMKY